MICAVAESALRASTTSLCRFRFDLRVSNSQRVWNATCNGGAENWGANRSSLKNRAALRVAKRGLAIMKIARSVAPLDPKVVRRREAAAKVTASLPRAWLDEFQTEDELAVLQTMGVLANGSCEMSRRELAERAGVTPHIVQRTVSTAVQLVERSVVAALNVLLNGDLQGTKPLILLVNDHLTLIILRRRVLAQRALWTRSWWEDSRW